MVNWHPLLAATEEPTGVWHLRDQYGHEYGRVELRRVDGGQPRYKAIWRDRHIGWATTLKRACEGVHNAYVRSLSAPHFQGYPDHAKDTEAGQ